MKNNTIYDVSLNSDFKFSGEQIIHIYYFYKNRTKVYIANIVKNLKSTYI